MTSEGTRHIDETQTHAGKALIHEVKKFKSQGAVLGNRRDGSVAKAGNCIISRCGV